MNLFIRLFKILLFSRFRARVGILEPCRTPFRVSITDLDVLRHMNNGKYFSLQDLARVDMMIRNGALPVFDRNGWFPVVVAESLQFRKSLKLFEAFTIQSRVVGWEERDILVEHIFRKGETEIAFGYALARFLKKTGGSVSAAELLQSVGHSGESPPLPPNAREWIRSVTAR